MYKHGMRDEEWNIHSHSYHSGGDGRQQESMYKESKYQDSSEPSSDYMRKRDDDAGDKKKEEENADSIDARIEKGGEMQKQKEEEKDYLQHKVIRENIKLGDDKKHAFDSTGKKKNLKSIEEAINKAIKEEKEVIVLE